MNLDPRRSAQEGVVVIPPELGLLRVVLVVRDLLDDDGLPGTSGATTSGSSRASARRTSCGSVRDGRIGRAGRERRARSSSATIRIRTACSARIRPARRRRPRLPARRDRRAGRPQRGNARRAPSPSIPPASSRASSARQPRRSATGSRSTTRTGRPFTLDDPYAFLPTLGELDLHLAGEGRHEELYAQLGAHVREVDGVAGTAFAVWAPAARSVSVVGDFNGWDGRLHPMRSLGARASGSSSSPSVEPGARYKYEIRGADGSLRAEGRPGRVRSRGAARERVDRHRSAGTTGHDGDWLERRRSEAARPPDLDLRGPPRLLAAQPARGQPQPHLPRARRRARRLRARPRLHPRRADAGDGAPVRGLVGLPGDRLLRADLALRHARRLPRVRRSPARPRASA